MREKKLAVVLALAFCVILAMPLVVTTGNPVDMQTNPVYNLSSDGYPTVDGEPLFTLHIIVASDSPIAAGVAEVISGSLRDIGIEGVVHILSVFDLLSCIFPSDYWGLDQPGLKGEPRLVDLTLHPPHFQHQVYDVQGDVHEVMWCGDDDPEWVTPPGYGNDWDDQLTKSFELPDGSVAMQYSIQYDTEPFFDVVSVDVSLDEGNTWSQLASHDGNSNGFEEFEWDLSAYSEQMVQIRFRFVSDIWGSDENGDWPTDGACRIDWVQLTHNDVVFSRDDFTLDSDGWNVIGNVIQIIQGYDMGYYALVWPDPDIFYSWTGFGMAHSESNSNQGYSNQEFDELYEELQSLPVEWSTSFPTIPDLNSPSGMRALEILDELQAIWTEDQPALVFNNRLQREGYFDETGEWVAPRTGFPLSPFNFNNEHLVIPEVRRAISLAMDRQATIEVYESYMLPVFEYCAVDSFLAPWHPAFDPVSYPEYDILAARQLLYDAGYTNILTQQAVTESIIDSIDSYVESGTLKAGAANALIKKLDGAVDLIEAQNYHAASQKLGDFIDQVNALVQSGRLPVEEGEYLIALAQELINMLYTP